MAALSRRQIPVREIRESEIALGRDWGHRGLSPPPGTQRGSRRRERGLGGWTNRNYVGKAIRDGRRNSGFETAWEWLGGRGRKEQACNT
jgi:hypothetical protein